MLTAFVTVVAGVITNVDGVGTNALFFNPYGVSISSNSQYALITTQLTMKFEKLYFQQAR